MNAFILFKDLLKTGFILPSSVSSASFLRIDVTEAHKRWECLHDIPITVTAKIIFYKTGNVRIT